MFDIGALELFVIVIVAVVVIGPKDMPLAMRTAGRWIGKVRRISAHFRTGVDAMVREAELEDMEKEWKARNEEIMRKSAPSSLGTDDIPDMAGPPMTGPPPMPTDTLPSEPELASSAGVSAESAAERAASDAAKDATPAPGEKA